MDGITAAVQMICMQLSARFLQIQLTDAQKKLVQHPISQSVLLFFMFYVASHNLILSLLMVIAYYIAITILLNETHPMNIYSKPWLLREGFIKEDVIEGVKKKYIKSLEYL